MNGRSVVGIMKKNRPLDVLHCFRKKTFFCSTSPHNTESKLEELTIKELQRSNISEFSSILLCISGGSDSIALLHLMNAIKRRHMPGLDLKVVNFNHKQRIEADEEAQFVSHIAARYGNDVIIKDLPLHLADKSFTQAIGRTWRRGECQTILDSLPNVPGRNKYIATAHHMDDQIETLLMKLIRGVHLTNLSMMKSLNGPFLRPMLSMRKADIVQYLTEHKYEWREDTSNQARDYTRNKVRLDLIPIMNELAGGEEVLQRRLLALSEQSKQVSLLVEQQVVDITKCLRTFYFDNYHVLSFEYLLKGTHYVNPEEIPAAVMQHILRIWLVMKIGLQINDYSLLSGIAGLFQADMKDRKSVAITISKKWDVVRIANELRLVPRSKVPPSSTSCTTILSYEGVNISAEHSSFLSVKVGSQHLMNATTPITVSPKVSILETGEEIEDEEFESGESIDDSTTNNNGRTYIHHQPYTTKFSIALPDLAPQQSLNLAIRLLQPNDKSLLIAGRRISKLITEKNFCNVTDRDRVFVVMHYKADSIDECIAVMTEDSYFPTQDMLAAESRRVMTLQLVAENVVKSI